MGKAGYSDVMNSEDILVALRRIMRAIDLHSKDLERQAGLTVPQLLILHSLNEHGQASSRELASRVSLSQGTVTPILDRMVAKQLVSRKPDTRDRRRVVIELTRRGERRLASAPDFLQEAFVARFHRLEDWEQAMLTAAVQRIADMMDPKNLDAWPILQAGELPTPSAKSELPGTDDQA